MDGGRPRPGHDPRCLLRSHEGAVRRSVVRISALGGGKDANADRFWGSGFFIAPGWVLTCAHVVGNGGGGVLDGATGIDITDWQGNTSEGRVELALPRLEHPDAPSRRWPLPDLALVEVAGAGEAECLWLSDRSAVAPAPASLHGWSRETGELALRFGTGTVTGWDAGGRALLLRGETPVAGCSGGPVVDTARGAVIGVSKGRGPDGGGLAVPVTELREIADTRPGRDLLHRLVRGHDRHHLRRYRQPDTASSWTDLQNAQRISAGGFTPGLRTQLYPLLAELPPPVNPGEVLALADRARKRVIQDPYQPGVEHDPRSWREGAGLLYGLRDSVGGREEGHGPVRDLELEAVLLYAAEVAAAVRRQRRAADEQPLSELCGWLKQASESISKVIRGEIDRTLAAPEGPRARADVIVEIDSSHYGDRYPWRVKLLYKDNNVRPLCGDEEGVPRGELHQTLRGPIAEALRQGDVGEHLADLQLVLPRELFDEPLDSWRLTPPGAAAGGIDPHTMPLGQRRLVYVRDRWRRDQPPIPEWHGRWRGAAAGVMTAVPLRQEVPRHGHSGTSPEGVNAAYRRLSEAPVTAVPVYCGPVADGGAGATAMAAALAAGHAVAIWRRSAPGHTDCADFHERADEFVQSVRTAGELHTRIRSLRRACADPDCPDEKAGWAQDIALLLDPPEPDPSGPLQAPGERPLGGP